MGLFNYTCKNCNKKFEVYIVPGAEIPEEKDVECPRCGSGNVKKMLSKVHFKFIGPGFYENDYKKKDND